jgi:hypothetical protein
MRAYALYIHASRPSVPVMAMQCAFTAVLRVGIRVGPPRPLSLTYAPCCARHEGEGSVFAVLKARGWAVELSAGESGMSFSAASLFSVNIVLTDEGGLKRPTALRGVSPPACALQAGWTFEAACECGSGGSNRISNAC